jgi:hypothetical protein
MHQPTTLRTMQHEDGAAVLDIQRGIISTLNETGAYIWQALQREDSPETIIFNLADKTGEDVEVVREGVTTFLEELKQHRLLSVLR